MAGLWNKNFRKRNVSIVLCMGLFVGCLSGCGGEYAGVTGGDAASGGAVSGSAISGSAISDKDMDAKVVSGSAIGKEQAADGSGEKMEQDMSVYRFCTDTNLYYEENINTIMQMRLDGTHKTCLVKDCDECRVIYVDKNWLYYAAWYFEGKEIIYRAPIRKDADGYDVVSISEKEKILTEEITFSPYYADSHYIFYNTYDTFTQYDLNKRRKISPTYVGVASVFRINDHYIAAINDEEEGSLLVQDINGEQWTRVSSFADDFFNDSKEYVTQNEQAVFYPQNLTEEEDDRRFRIRRYDGEKETDFLTWEQIEKTVLEAEDLEPGELDFAGPDHLFWQGDRLYIQIQVGWEKDGIYHEEFMILSQAEGEDGSGLRYEREFTECMRSHVKTRKGKWVDYRGLGPKAVLVDHMVVNSANCIAMVNGKAYLCLIDYEKNEGRLGCYELNTGKFQWVDREDRLFYEIGYDYNLSEFEGVYNKIGYDPKEDDYTGNEFEPYWRTPSADKEEYGSFAEE